MLPIKYTRQFEVGDGAENDQSDGGMNIAIYLERKRELSALNARYANLNTKLFWRRLGMERQRERGRVAQLTNVDQRAVGITVDQWFRRKLCRSLQMSEWKEVVCAHKSPVTCISMDTSEQRYLLSAGSDATIALYDMEEDIGVGEPAVTTASAVSPSTPISATGSVRSNESGGSTGSGGSGRSTAIKLKRSLFEAIGRVTRKNSHAYTISCMEWYPHDTGLFATGSFDRYIKIWDTNQMKPACDFKFPDKVYALSMSPIAGKCSTLVAGASRNQNVRLCDMATGAFVQSLTGHKGPVMAVRFSPVDENILVTGSADRTVRVWDLRKAGWLFCLDQFHTHYNPKDSHQRMQRFSVDKYHPNTEVPTAHNSMINALCFTPDGRHLMSAGKDNQIRRWDMQTGENTLVSYPSVVNVIQTGYQFAISTDGSTLYHPNSGTIGCYDTESGRLLSSLVGHYNTVRSCIFVGRDQELISAGSDRQIFVWTPERRHDSFRESLDNTIGHDDSDTWSDEG